MDNKEKRSGEEMTEMLTTRQVARLLNYPRDYITRCCCQGKIPAVRVLGQWRIRREWVEQALSGKGG